MFLFFNLLSRFLPIPKVTARVALVVLVSASLLFAHMAHKRAVERTVTVAQEAVRIEYQHEDNQKAADIRTRVDAARIAARLRPKASGTDTRGFRD